MGRLCNPALLAQPLIPALRTSHFPNPPPPTLRPAKQQLDKHRGTYFVVAQRRKACRLPPPQHGEARSVVSPNMRGRGHYNDSPLRTWCLVRTGRPRVSTIKPRAKTAPMATTVHCRSVWTSPKMITPKETSADQTYISMTARR